MVPFRQIYIYIIYWLFQIRYADHHSQQIQIAQIRSIRDKPELQSGTREPGFRSFS